MKKNSICACGESRQNQFRKQYGSLCRSCHNFRQSNPDWKDDEKVRQIRELEKAYWGVAR